MNMILELYILISTKREYRGYLCSVFTHNRSMVLAAIVTAINATGEELRHAGSPFVNILMQAQQAAHEMSKMKHPWACIFADYFYVYHVITYVGCDKKVRSFPLSISCEPPYYFASVT